MIGTAQCQLEVQVLERDVLKNELILELGAEGGSIKLLGTRSFDGWLLRASSVDQSAMFLSDEDRGDDLLESRYESDWVDSWEAALALLDKYPWHRLVPLVVHPEFQERVWTAVQKRFERDKSEGRPASSDWDLERWRERCGVPRR